MSTTDQAFIRAYQQEIAAGNAVKPLPVQAQHPPIVNDSPAPRAPNSKAVSADEHQPLAGTASTGEPTGSSTPIAPQESHWQAIDSVHVGLGSVVPPPHAKFPGLGSAAAPISAAQSFSVPANIPVRIDPQHNFLRDTASLRSKLQRSPKASLSTFAQPIVAVSHTAQQFRPALEIDAVRWPPVCHALLAQYADRFDNLTKELQFEAEAGRQVTAITGIDRGEGRTTLALCLAKRMAARGIKLALVDADFEAPQLAQQLGLDVERGWETTLFDEDALNEVMIESLTDGLAIVPLGRKANSLAAAMNTLPLTQQIFAALDQLKVHFDLVLVDAGPLGTSPAADRWLIEAALGIDSIIVAHDFRRCAPHRLAAACLQLAEAATNQLGIAEMFAAENMPG